MLPQVFLPAKAPQGVIVDGATVGESFAVVAIDHDRCARDMERSDHAKKNTQLLAELIEKECKNKVDRITLVSFSNRQSDKINALLNKGDSTKPTNLAHLDSVKKLLQRDVRIDVCADYFLEMGTFETLDSFKKFAKEDTKKPLVAAIVQKFRDASFFLFIDDVEGFLPKPNDRIKSVVFYPLTQDPATIKLLERTEQ